MTQFGSASWTLEPRFLYRVQTGSLALRQPLVADLSRLDSPCFTTATFDHLCSAENRASSYHDVPNLLPLREATMRSSIIVTGKAVPSPSLRHHARRPRALEPPPLHLSLNCSAAHRLTS